MLHADTVPFLSERGILSVAPCGKGVFALKGLSPISGDGEWAVMCC